MTISSYDLETSLLGHVDSVNALQFSPTGKYLASGGQDGQLFIFSAKTWKPVRKYADPSPLTALVWHPTFPKTLICGFASGDIITICFDSTEDAREEKTWVDKMPDTIECISLDPLGVTIAIGHGEKVSVIDQSTISVWRNIRVLPDPPSFDNLKEKLSTLSARSLHFMREKDSLLVSYLEHGIVCWDIRSVTMKWRIVPRTCYIGRSSLSPDERFIIVSNLFDGFDLYSLSDHTIRHTVPIRINPEKNWPVPVMFTMDGDSVIAGGTNRGARVLDSRTSETIQVLPHDGDIVQAVGVHDYKDGTRTIVAGVSEIGQSTTIKVWQGRSTQAQADQEGEEGQRENSDDGRNAFVHTRVRQGSGRQIPLGALSIIVLLASMYLLSGVEDPVQVANMIFTRFQERVRGSNTQLAPQRGQRRTSSI